MALHDGIINALASRGLRARFASLSHIGRVRDRIDDLAGQGLLSESFVKRYLSWMAYGTDHFPEARSILVIARPEPIIGLCFHHQGGDIHTVIPPTYIHRDIIRMVSKTVEKIISPHRFAPTRLPDKTLAVSAGLAQYGRNNICYVAGMGSFVNLFSYYTDIPYDTDIVNTQPVMAACETCRLCLNACPTGSIREEHFCIDAERCLTYFNESDGSFPGWIDPDWHNAIVGCMHCQAVCPQNKDLIGTIERQVDFTEKETEIILSKTPWDALPGSLRETLDSLDMAEYYGVLKRNLRVLL